MPRLLLALGAGLGWIALHLARVRRTHVEAAMARAGLFGGAAAAYRSLGLGVAELVLARLDPGAALARVEIEPASLAALRSAIAAGPVVLACSHTANWELAAFAAARVTPLACVVKPMSNGAIDAFCTRLRESFGLRLISPRGALARARRAISDGLTVAMMIDQVPDRDRHATRAPFLGAVAAIDRGPFALAARSGATVLVTAAHRDAGGLTRVRVLGAFSPPREDRAAWIVETARAATALLDAFVREHPASWLWLHRRWKRNLAATGQRAVIGHPCKIR